MRSERTTFGQTDIDFGDFVRSNCHMSHRYGRKGRRSPEDSRGTIILVLIGVGLAAVTIAYFLWIARA
jgi:hypothetical protein